MPSQYVHFNTIDNHACMRYDQLLERAEQVVDTTTWQSSLCTYCPTNQMPALNMLPNSVARVAPERVFGLVAPSHWLCLGKNQNKHQACKARLLNGLSSIFSAGI